MALLLVEILNWTRKQPGTTSLRALVYFDEVFGYLPPHPANPPTKVPLMTLLKQARAFGVGVLLATQNPVDLDYKALSNAGTWFIGKLQTERDKARLVEGLEGVAAERGTLSDRNYLEGVISALDNRVFLLHDVHQPQPVVFQSRWALSFLRGPMNREQIATLDEAAQGETGRAARRSPARPRRSRSPCRWAAKPVAVPVDRAQDQEFRQRLQQAGARRPPPRRGTGPNCRPTCDSSSCRPRGHRRRARRSSTGRACWPAPRWPSSIAARGWNTARRTGSSPSRRRRARHSTG